MDFCVNTIPENQRYEVSFLEYNTKTRMGIWLCLLLMMLVLAIILTGVFNSARQEEDRLVSATAPDDEAIYVNASPKPQETTSAETTNLETTAPPASTTDNHAADTEKKPIYYVTISGNQVVLLGEYGEYLETLNENALFLPKNDLAALRAGIALYSKDELSDLVNDLS